MAAVTRSACTARTGPRRATVLGRAVAPDTRLDRLTTLAVSLLAAARLCDWVAGRRERAVSFASAELCCIRRSAAA